MSGPLFKAFEALQAGVFLGDGDSDGRGPAEFNVCVVVTVTGEPPSRNFLALFGSAVVLAALFPVCRVLVKAVAAELKPAVARQLGVVCGGVVGASGSEGLVRLTLPRRMLRVRAWADSSGYMESSMRIEFS